MYNGFNWSLCLVGLFAAMVVHALFVSLVQLLHLEGGLQSYTLRNIVSQVLFHINIQQLKVGE